MNRGSLDDWNHVNHGQQLTMSAAPIEHHPAGYKHYLQDPPGEQLGETARVWHMYGDEAREIDKEMIDEYKESIDILLVFVRGPLHTTV